MNIEDVTIPNWLHGSLAFHKFRLFDFRAEHSIQLISFLFDFNFYLIWGNFVTIIMIKSQLVAQFINVRAALNVHK